MNQQSKKSRQYVIGRMQQIIANLLLYVFAGLVLLVITTDYEIPTWLALTLAGGLAASIVGFSINRCSNCGKSIFDHGGPFPASVSNVSNSLAPVKTCHHCGKDIV